MFGNICSLSSYNIFICRYLQPLLTLGHVWQNVQPRGSRKKICVEGQLVVFLWLSVPLGWNACLCINKLDHTSLRWLLIVGSAPFYYMYQFWLLIQRTHLKTFEWNFVKEQFLNMSENVHHFPNAIRWLRCKPTACRGHFAVIATFSSIGSKIKLTSPCSGLLSTLSLFCIYDQFSIIEITEAFITFHVMFWKCHPYKIECLWMLKRIICYVSRLKGFNILRIARHICFDLTWSYLHNFYGILHYSGFSCAPWRLK